MFLKHFFVTKTSLTFTLFLSENLVLFDNCGVPIICIPSLDLACFYCLLAMHWFKDFILFRNQALLCAVICVLSMKDKTCQLVSLIRPRNASTTRTPASLNTEEKLRTWAVVATGINLQVAMETRASNGVTVTCVTKNLLRIRHLGMNLAKKIRKKNRIIGLLRCLVTEAR